MAAPGVERRRTCIGCRSARPVGELVRFAFVGDRLRVGRTLPGRGAWICVADPACVQRATAPERLRRAFRRSIPPGASESLVVDMRTGRTDLEPSAATA